jgi:site-specific recombinase XerD
LNNCRRGYFSSFSGGNGCLFSNRKYKKKRPILVLPFVIVKIAYMLPSLQLLEKVSRKIMSVPNRRKESKRGVHFCLFLLGYKSGLRISEAVKFDLAKKTKKGLYRIEKSKGQKERLVYIPPKVISELRKNN